MAVEFEHLGQLSKAFNIFNRVKGMIVNSGAFLCLVESSITELENKIAKRYKLHVNRSILRDASVKQISRGGFFDQNS
jgi:hypothetical protein